MSRATWKWRSRKGNSSKFHARYSTKETETRVFKNTKDEGTWVTDDLGERLELTFDFEER